MNDIGNHVVVSTHEFRFVEPDEVHFIFRGLCDAHAGAQCRQFIYAHASRTQRLLYMLMDLSKFDRLTANGRKDIVHVNRPFPIRYGAFVGTNFPTRVLVRTVTQAGRILAPDYFNYPYEFFATADEAVAWFGELRKKNAATASNSGPSAPW